MEQDNEITPTIDSREHEAAKAKDVVVFLTKEELENLDSLGPDNENVKAWLTANNLKEGDHLVARIEGQEDRVLVTEADDFMTRDVAATDAWNEAKAAAARSIWGIEADIDAHSQEIGQESESGVRSEDELREVGEETLEISGVEDPSEDEKTPSVEIEKGMSLESLEFTYEQKVESVRGELSADLAQVLKVLDEQGEVETIARRTIIDSVEVSVAELSSAINHYDDYPSGAIQTLIKRTIAGLETVHGAAGRFGEGSLQDLTKAIEFSKTSVAKQKEQASTYDTQFTSVLAEQGHAAEASTVETAGAVVEVAEASLGGVDELEADLRKLDVIVGEVRREGLGRGISRLNDILQQSYSRPIDAEELVDTIRYVQSTVPAGGDFDLTLRKVSRGLKAFDSQVKSAHERISTRNR